MCGLPASDDDRRSSLRCPSGAIADTVALLCVASFSALGEHMRTAHAGCLRAQGLHLPTQPSIPSLPPFSPIFGRALFRQNSSYNGCVSRWRLRRSIPVTTAMKQKLTSKPGSSEWTIMVLMTLIRAYTYLLIRRYNRFAVLACLRSVRNRSRSRAFVCQYNAIRAYNACKIDCC